MILLNDTCQITDKPDWLTELSKALHCCWPC